MNMNITSRMCNTKWMIDQSAHTDLMKKIDVLAESPNLPVFAEAELNNDLPANATELGSTAIISIGGILAKDVSPMEEACLGLCDVEWISDALSNAVEDINVSNIVLNLRSPGGETCGIEELGRKIANIDKHIKPVYGWTDKISTSAAYWLMSQCREIGMTPSSEVAGIGVYSLVLNATEQMKQNGLSMFVASSGKYKMMGHDFRSLTDEEKKILMDSSVEQHEKFKAVILSKRPNVTIECMEGLSYEGEDAIQKQLVDVLFDSMDEFLIYINSSAATIKDNMKQMTKTKIETSATSKVDITPVASETTVVIETEAKQAEVPGVPGTEAEAKVEEEEKKPESQVEKQSDPIDNSPDEDDEDDEDEDEDDEECECSHCKGTGKMKKAKEPEPEAEVEEAEGEEKQTPRVSAKMQLPSDAEWQSAFGLKHATSKDKLSWDNALKSAFTGNFN